MITSEIFKTADYDGDALVIEHYHAPGNTLAANGKEAIASATVDRGFVYLSADDLAALRVALPAPAEAEPFTLPDPSRVWVVEDGANVPTVHPCPLRSAALKEARDILASVTTSNVFGMRTVSAADLVTLAAYLAEGVTP